MSNKLLVKIVGLIACFLVISIFAFKWSTTRQIKPSVPEKPPEVFEQTPSVNVRLYFQPANMSLPPSASLKLMLDAKDFKIGFVGLKIDFDKTKVRLSGEITSSDKLKTVVRKSSAADANATGIIILTLGLAIEDKDNPPKGIFELASIPLEVVSAEINGITSFSIQDGSVEIVGILGPDNFSDLTYTKEAAQITINPIMSPTPTITPVKSPTPTVTPVITNTPTPTRTPTLTVTPVNSPTPTTTPVNSPTPSPTSINTPTPTPLITNTPTPTPVITNTPTLTSIPANCPKKTQGDANCDNIVDITDYQIWRCFFVSGGHCLGPFGNFDPDFNKDRIINLIDFEIWRRNTQ